MNQLEDLEKGIYPVDSNEYEYNITNIHKAYANCFDLDIGLPSTTIEIGKEFNLPLKAFMAWRALISSYYYCEVIPNIENESFSWTLSYYDKYELPTCYRIIRFSFCEFTLMSKVANEKETIVDASSIRKIIGEYLQVLGFIRIRKIKFPKYTKWQCTIDIYNKIRMAISKFIKKFIVDDYDCD